MGEHIQSLSFRTRAFLLGLSLLLIGCNVEPSDTTLTPSPTATVGYCRIPDNGIIPRPITTPHANPSMNTPTPLSSGTITPTNTPTSTPLPWCTPTSTPIPLTPPPTPQPTPTSHFSAPIQSELGIGGDAGSGGGGAGGGVSTITNGTGVDSLTLDVTDQSILSVAAGPQQTALFWLDGENGVMAAITQSPGFGQQIVYSMGGSDVDAVYSDAGRLHVVTVKSGALYYRYTDDTHIALVDDVRIAPGSSPTIMVDNNGWPHVFFASGGSIYHVSRNGDGWQPPDRVTSGDSVSAVGTSDGRLITAVRSGSTVRIYTSDGGGWGERSSFNADGLIGTPQLDTSENFVYVAWMTEQLDPTPNDWPRRRPEYKGAFPFVNRIASGENAQQYFTSWGLHDAGLYQTVPTSPGASLSVSAQYMGWSCGEPSSCGSAGYDDPNPSSGSGANMNARICIDPTGGVDIYSPSVVCSGGNNTLDSWTTLSMSAVAQASNVTIFLRSTPDLPRMTQDVYWDNVQLSGATLINPDLEDDYAPWEGVQELKVASGWIPFYVEDPPTGVGSGLYQVQTAWSSDGGGGWSDAVVVTKNTTSSRAKDGAFRPDVYPLISPDEGYVSFVFLFMDGNPTSAKTKRYGRPAMAACELGENNCEGFWRVLPNAENRPAVNLVADPSHGDSRYIVVAWDAYQSSNAAAKDVYSTILAP